MNTHIPLAERMRPTSLEQIVGQEHLLGSDAPITRMLQSGHLPSLILHGEAGIGKTTIARLLSSKMGRQFHWLSALDLTVKGLKELMNNEQGLNFGAPVLFIDEIHRFNKAQQDALLGAVEKGVIVLIGATTENPSFSVNHALLSRCQVYRLYPPDEHEIVQVLQRAISQDPYLKSLDITLVEPAAIAKFASGDVRKALNLLEMAVYSAAANKTGNIVIDHVLIEQVAQTLLPRYDKDGDMHYDLASAMIKSIRGSDADAALYWLARMLVAGEPPEFVARRLLICASEDIGLANPNALLLADSAMRSVKAVGMPEARIILGQVAIYLATSAKSNTAYKAINEAMSVAQHDQSPVPLHLRNGVTALMKSQGYGQGYVYPHDYPNHYHPQQYLPDSLLGRRFYQYGDNPKEQALKAYMAWLKGDN